MVKNTKEYGVSLLQRHPSKEVLLEKMRGKLATTPAPAVTMEIRQREARRKNAKSWIWRTVIALLFFGANFMLIGKKDAIIRTIGMEAVPSLPKPDKTLSDDEQALYWTYALYDFRKFREHFGMNEYLAINPKFARSQLEALLPRVSSPVLGKISAYGSIVAFKSVAPGEVVQ